MKPVWKIMALLAVPLLIAAGEQKKAEDLNDTGKDDATGEALVFSGKLIGALVNDKPLPKVPDVLRN